MLFITRIIVRICDSAASKIVINNKTNTVAYFVCYLIQGFWSALLNDSNQSLNMPLSARYTWTTMKMKELTGQWTSMATICLVKVLVPVLPLLRKKKPNKKKKKKEKKKNVLHQKITQSNPKYAKRECTQKAKLPSGWAQMAYQHIKTFLCLSLTLIVRSCFFKWDARAPVYLFNNCS